MASELTIGERIAEDWARGHLSGTVAEAIDFHLRDLKRENKRLREALRRVANMEEDPADIAHMALHHPNEYPEPTP